MCEVIWIPLLTEHMSGERHLTPRHRLPGRLAERHAIRAIGDAPLAEAVLPVESCEQTRIGGDGHRAFTWLQLHALESQKAHALLAGRVSEVDLRHVGAR